jgi:hypothetical protein
MPALGGSTMNYLLSVLIIAVVGSQAMVWHSLAPIRDAIQQTNAIILAACGSDERPCQVAAHRGQIELGEVMVHSRVSDGFSCGYSRFNPCWITTTPEEELVAGSRSGPSFKANTAEKPTAP